VSRLSRAIGEQATRVTRTRDSFHERISRTGGESLHGNKLHMLPLNTHAVFPPSLTPNKSHTSPSTDAHTVREPNHHYHQPRHPFRVSNVYICTLLSVLHTVRQIWRQSFDNTMLNIRSVKRICLRQLYSWESSAQILSHVHTITWVLPKGNEQRNYILARRLFTLQEKFYINTYEQNLTPVSIPITGYCRPHHNTPLTDSRSD
jgi:hypothetical protein